MTEGAIRRVGTAGTVYFAAIFALGFVLGTVRILWLAPRIGLIPATIFELPIMLGASILVARRLIRSRGLQRPGELVAMGVLGCALLLGAELLLGVIVFDMTAVTWAASLFTGAGAIGLAGQLGFAAMPALIGGVRKDSPHA